LINEVVPDGALAEAVDRWLAEIHALSPRYLEISKASSNLWWNLSKDNMQAGVEALIQAAGSDDMREGATAFLEKRRPRFRPDAD
jgi:enoyl-CoA hydratase/carnithine racemase